MGPLLAMGAMLECSFGVAPSPLVVLPENRVLADGLPLANINDHEPELNITTFGMCSSLANPEVATATAAASGVLTPMPCIPVTIEPWFPGVVNVLIGGMPALDETCQCLCAWGGLVKPIEPGQFKVESAV